ncbi:tRNA (adenosine(37)-N6)-threonylcarbamoyltransferase complex ATPase subunit type 1 TsaE [Bacillus fonticola]|uniref:tRNA (adenosine(37)-N6)-threonylcarbamoyltransferase complex ATPase subunit type 1 TsaE n=1 Tax=Bacillus fonticola TaxID=2728853 RepID=UPI001473AF19|nr:tRNA (adenosine(37)-N6)-threonylcarbamoyltransferase complex ATPase subunit type 1 TsaE [Bacillus fonticola]
MQKVWNCLTADELQSLGKVVGEVAQPGLVVTLHGPLGAGKTTFTKGLALGLDVKEMVNSPTYTLLKEYEGRLPLYHFDVYRVESEEEELGFEEYFDSDVGVVVVEWPSRIEGILPMDRLDIHISYEEKGRSVRVESGGTLSQRVLEEMQS